MTVGEMVDILESCDKDKEILVTWFDGTLCTFDDMSEMTFDKFDAYGMTPKVVALSVVILGRKKETKDG